MKKLLLITATALPLMVGNALADQVFLDDIIVDGSACIGFDCVNGESFGFDTIRLKENNMRIKAQDTSTSASFPSRDWQITFNDSSNGGANKFAIDDIDGGRTPFTIEADARTNALYVEDDGDVGLGTSNPVVNLHIVDGNTPTLRLEQDGSSGFTPQTWDVAGNEAGFFIRDATNGSTLPLRIRPGAIASMIDIRADDSIEFLGEGVNAKVVFETDGSVGIGTTTPDSNLDIEDGNPEIRFTGTTSGEQWEMRVNGAGVFNFQNIGTTNNSFSIDPASSSDLLRLGRDAAGLSVPGQVTISGSLVIDGSCSATGSTTNCGADYVFEPDYKRLPLEELKTFVTTNKHLPNIPTAAEMTKNGIQITELSVQLLAKVEELTLYTIDQHETINQLKGRLDKLESTAE